MKVICVGGERDGWEGTILHGTKVCFPAAKRDDGLAGPVEYQIMQETDAKGRNIALPIQPQK